MVTDGQDGPGRLLSPATVDRILAAVSSFYDWAIVAEEYDHGVSPVQMRTDPALARMPDRHQPYMGRASRQQPVRRVVQVKRPRRLPRPMNEPDLEVLLSGLKRLRDLAMLLLMLDGGLRPGEVLSLHLQDISYGRRRVTIRKRDDHPHGARGKSRTERVVDLHEPRTLEAVSRYVMHERPLEATSPFVFLVGPGRQRCEPLSYDALVKLFSRRMSALGLRTPETTPHALRHTPRPCGRAACVSCRCRNASATLRRIGEGLRQKRSTTPPSGKHSTVTKPSGSTSPASRSATTPAPPPRRPNGSSTTSTGSATAFPTATAPARPSRTARTPTPA